MQKVILLCLVLLAVASAQQQRRKDWWNTGGKSMLLKSNNFGEFVGKDKHAIVQFFGTHPSYATESQRLNPEWDRLADMYMENPTAAKKDIIVAKIDGWTFPAISQKYGLKSFPAILFFPKGNSEPKERYLSQERTAQKLSEWIEYLITAQEKEDKENLEKEAKEKAAQESAAAATQSTNNATEGNNTASDANTTETANTNATPEPISDEGQNAGGDETVVNVVVDETPQEPEPEPEPVAEPEPVKAQQQAAPKTQPKPQQTQQQAQQPKTQPPAQQKELKVVLDTNLLKGQFTALQGQIDTANQKLHGNIADSFKKVDELKELINKHTQDIANLNNNLNTHGAKFDEIKNGLNTNKQEVHKSITQSTDKQFEELKNALNQVKAKVFEKREEVKGIDFGQGTLFFVVGSLFGAGVAYIVLNNQRNNNRRKLLID